VGPLHETGSRKTLVYLILTLNHIYPDYDFSLLRAHHFKKEEGVAAIEETIDAHLVEASKVSGLAGSWLVGRLVHWACWLLVAPGLLAGWWLCCMVEEQRLLLQSRR
jgi:hypothetical protein